MRIALVELAPTIAPTEECVSTGLVSVIPLSLVLIVHWLSAHPAAVEMVTAAMELASVDKDGVVMLVRFQPV